MNELIHLQSAHITQLTNNGIKGDWVIKKNISGETLHTFPPHISDELMFKILEFGKYFELIAFNEGIKLQKDKQNQVLREKLDVAERIIRELSDENVRLSTILENLYPEE